jgi:hypothetical protein
MEDSAADYLRLMQNPRYAKVAAAQTPEEAIAHQSRSGYATSPQYGSSLRAIHSANMAEGGIARLNVPRYNGEYGSLTGEEREKYLAELGQPKKEAASPAGRFFGNLFNETPEQKKIRIQREAAQNDLNRVTQQFGSKIGATGAFKEQTNEEYDNAQNAISQANRNLNAARAGRGYVPPDPYGGNYKPEIRNLQTPVQGGMSPEYEPSALGGVGMSPEYEPSTKAPAGNTGGGNTGSGGSDSSGGSGSSVGSGSKGGERQKKRIRHNPRRYYESTRRVKTTKARGQIHGYLASRSWHDGRNIT